MVRKFSKVNPKKGSKKSPKNFKLEKIKAGNVAFSILRKRYDELTREIAYRQFQVDTLTSKRKEVEEAYLQVKKVVTLI